MTIFQNYFKYLKSENRENGLPAYADMWKKNTTIKAITVKLLMKANI